MKKVFQISLGIGILAALLAICFFIFHIPDFWPQLLAIIASAFLGAGVTAWITNTLLNNKQKSEEEKERNIKIYENKIKVYSQFISKLWGTLKDDVISNSEVDELRFYTFQEMVLFLSDSDVERIKNEVKKIMKFNVSDDDCSTSYSEKDKYNLYNAFSNITQILKEDLEGIINEKNESERTLKTDLKKISRTIKSILRGFVRYFTGKMGKEVEKDADVELSALTRFYKSFNVEPQETTSIFPLEETEVFITHQQDNNGNAETTTSVDNERENNDTQLNKLEYNQAWHFAMLGDEQLDAIGEGKINELSLIEYEESWRTNLVKQVRENDVVFLFRRGGYGYIGAFRPKGWRIFEYGDNEKPYEKIHRFGEEELMIKEEALVNSDVEKYDIYGGIKDSADFCSNLIVEPIYYLGYEAGTNPGGVYRRTISRYDAGYATRLMEWFEENN